MHGPGKWEEGLPPTVSMPASDRQNLCVCKRTILNELKKNTGFSCVVFSGWRKRYQKEQICLYAMSCQASGMISKKIKAV